MRKFLVLGAIGAAVLACCGCVRAVKTGVGAATSVGGAAVKTSAGAVKAGASVASGKDDAEDKDRHHDDDPRPYDPDRDAMADVDLALEAAAISGRNVLLVLGANWCHDSRGLAAKFQRPELARVLKEGYELVFVDVGQRDRNLDVGARFGVPAIFGTPTVLILSPSARLLNADTVHDWRTADSKPYDETLQYFEAFSPVRDQ
ncbi:MAG: thioredoxin family protein [Pseudomonadota bacterium]